MNEGQDGGTVGALDQPTMLLNSDASSAYTGSSCRQTPETRKCYLLIKHTPNGRATEAVTASGSDTKVGVKVQAASRPLYDHPTGPKPHVLQPAMADLLGCILGTR